MVIRTGAGKKFMEELPLGIHTLFEGTPDDIKVALYGPNAIIAPTTDTYTTGGEIVGGGYTAGGVSLPSGLTVVGSSGSNRQDGTQFDNPYINPTLPLSIGVVGVAVRGCMLYNATQGDRNIFTLDFGATFTPSQGILLNWGLADVDSIDRAMIPLVGNVI
jgi:hypothetical protein